jgi:hypothetical protein
MRAGDPQEPAMRHARPLLCLLLLLLAGCDHVQPSPVGTNCVTHGRGRIPVCE